MLIPHPLLGSRDAQEFTYLGDASLLNRPDGMAEGALDAFNRHVYLRDNPAGEHREYWHHLAGCRRWLIVARDTVGHEVTKVEDAASVRAEDRA